MMITYIILYRVLNLESLKDVAAAFHLFVQSSIDHNLQRGRNAIGSGELPKFTESDYVLVARDDFTASEKLSLRLRGLRRIIKAINDYV